MAKKVHQLNPKINPRKVKEIIFPDGAFFPSFVMADGKVRNVVLFSTGSLAWMTEDELIEQNKKAQEYQREQEEKEKKEKFERSLKIV